VPAVLRPLRWRWPARTLAALLAAAIVVLAADDVRGTPDDLAAAIVVAILFAIVEAAVVDLEIGGHAVALGLRATPFLVGLAVTGLPELLAAEVLGMSLGLAVRRRAGASAILWHVVGAWVATFLAAPLFRFAPPTDSDDLALLWVNAAGAAALLGIGCAIVDGWHLRRPVPEVAMAAGAAGAAAVADASLAITVVIFLFTEPSEVWLLLGPAVVAVACYRAWSRLRRRERRMELLYAVARVFDGAATGSAMLSEVLELVRGGLQAEVAEVLLEDVTDAPMRAAVGPGSQAEALGPVPGTPLVQRRALIPSGEVGVLQRRGSSTDGSTPLVDGMVARFDRPGRVAGTITVVGRAMGGRFDRADRLLLEAVAEVLADGLGDDRLPEELRASVADLERLAALVAGTDDAIIGVTPDGIVTSWNPAAAALFGQPADVVLGRPGRILAEPGADGAVEVAFLRALLGVQTRDVHGEARRPDGRVVPVSATVSPVRNGDAVVGVSIIARDMTARTVEEMLLRASLEQFEGAFKGSPAAMGVISDDFTWWRANDALCRLLGVRDDALVGTRFELSVAREDIEPAHGLVSRVLRGEADASSGEVRLRSDGAEATIAQVTVRGIRTRGGAPQVLCTLEDVTSLRARERQARERKARLQQALLDLSRIREPREALRATAAAAREATGARFVRVRIPAPDVRGRWQVEGDDAGNGTVDERLEGERSRGVGVQADREAPRPGPLMQPAWASAAAVPTPCLSVPIRLDDGTTGSLALADKPGGGEFDDDDMASAGALASTAAVTIDDARAHERSLTLLRELDLANAALREASAARSRFLANITHELRTPLHAILLASRLLVDPVGRPGRQRTRTLPATIEGSGRYLLSLIDDLVDLSRIELSELRVEPLDLAIAPVLDGVRDQLAALAAEKGVGLAIPAASRLRVHADPLRLRQVLVNLVSNAIKYTPPGGRVRVTARGTGGRVEVAVEDTGIGIAAADLERIFEPFERLHHQATPGAGLGLPIARRIVELHGGTLTAHSEPGSGSTFRLTIPRAAAVPERHLGAPRRRPVGMARRAARPVFVEVDAVTARGPATDSSDDSSDATRVASRGAGAGSGDHAGSVAARAGRHRDPVAAFVDFEAMLAAGERPGL
jgi:PAS domain S-box-containing protein